MTSSPTYARADFLNDDLIGQGSAGCGLTIVRFGDSL
jgi:hypothetical protein